MPCSHIRVLRFGLRAMWVVPSFLDPMPVSSDGSQCCLTCLSMAHQPATNDGTSAADPTQAVEIDGMLSGQGSIDGIENFDHGGRSAGNSKVMDREALVKDLDPPRRR